MGNATEISWTDATFNGWEGCQKVGPGCDHCYAEARNARFGGGEPVNWGPGAPRRRTSIQNWNLPKRWNARPFYECAGCGWRGDSPGVVRIGSGDFAVCPVPKCARETHVVRRRVFCSSLSDVFDNAVDPQWRVDLFELIRATPNLDWLLLTKRIGNVKKMGVPIGPDGLMLPNIWLGATIVNQEEADRDIPKLLAVPARVRFLSMEPLLGAVDLTDLSPGRGESLDALTGVTCTFAEPKRWQDYDRGLDWVIVGGESGKEARPMNPDWVRSLREQCEAAGVPLHFKQWGEWADSTGRVGVDHSIAVWPEGNTSVKVGKKAAGRELDGRTHNEFPRVTP